MQKSKTNRGFRASEGREEKKKPEGTNAGKGNETHKKSNDVNNNKQRGGKFIFGSNF